MAPARTEDVTSFSPKMRCRGILAAAAVKGFMLESPVAFGLVRICFSWKGTSASGPPQRGFMIQSGARVMAVGGGGGAGGGGG